MLIKFFKWELNVEELAVGAFVQLPFFFIIKLWVLPLALLSALFWALGGAENSSKLFRRVGVTLLTCLFIWGFKAQYALVWAALPGALLAMSIGYGVDSWLWNFFLRIRNNHQVADFCTRLTTYILYWLSFASVLIWIK